MTTTIDDILNQAAFVRYCSVRRPSSTAGAGDRLAQLIESWRPDDREPFEVFALRNDMIKKAAAISDPPPAFATDTDAWLLSKQITQLARAAQGLVKYPNQS